MKCKKISKSQELKNALDDIAIQIWEYKENLEQSDKHVPFFTTLTISEEQFIETFKKLLHQCIEDNFDWQFCPIEVYRTYFQHRKEKFVLKYLNSTSIDFVNEELEQVESDSWVYYFPHPRFGGEEVPLSFNPMGVELQKTLKYIQGRKAEFLKAELKKIEQNPEYYSDYFENILPPNYIRDIKNRNIILAGFITSADSDKKLELLPYNDFLKKYNQLTERGQIAFLFELKKIISNGAISKTYLLKEWKDINLKSLVNSQLDSINRINDLETEMQIDEKSETKKTISENYFPEIFKNDGCQVFWLLNEKYQNSNKKLKAKYSNLYHYLKYEDLLRCTQLEYIEFIKEQFGVEMSKILPKTLKYEDDIQSLLMKYHKGQQ